MLHVPVSVWILVFSSKHNLLVKIPPEPAYWSIEEDRGLSLTAAGQLELLPKANVVEDRPLAQIGSLLLQAAVVHHGRHNHH